MRSASPGCQVTDLASEFGTPLFVIDEDDFRARCRAMANAFGGGDHVHYAAKAFLCTEVARWIAEEGLSLDVCSGGELAVALHAGFPPERIALHGNNKSIDELTAAVRAGIGHVVLDSMTEIERLDEIAGQLGVVQDVLVRVTVGVEAHTHEFISTAHEDQKFGLSLADGQAMARHPPGLRYRPSAIGRPAQPHRLPDLRRRRFRTRRTPGDRPVARRRRRIRRGEDRADLDDRSRWRTGHLRICRRTIHRR